MEFWSRYMKLKKSRKADGISRLSTKPSYPGVTLERKIGQKLDINNMVKKLNSFVMR